MYTLSTTSNKIKPLFPNKILNNFKFLLLAEGNTTKHFALILVNQQIAATVVSECTFFFMDGTFRTTPRQQQKVLNLRSSQVHLKNHSYLNKNIPL